MPPIGCAWFSLLRNPTPRYTFRLFSSNMKFFSKVVEYPGLPVPIPCTPMLTLTEGAWADSSASVPLARNRNAPCLLSSAIPRRNRGWARYHMNVSALVNEPGAYTVFTSHLNFASEPDAYPPAAHNGQRASWALATRVNIQTKLLATRIFFTFRFAVRVGLPLGRLRLPSSLGCPGTRR